MMRFHGVVRMFSDLRPDPIAIGDLIILPYVGGGWQLCRWTSLDGIPTWSVLGTHDDLSDALAVVAVSSAAPDMLRLDGEHDCTPAEWLAANREGLDGDEIAEVLRLRRGETYTGGGGAAATWTVEAR